MLGRVNAVSRFMMWGTIPLGTLLGGALGSTIGLRETLWIGTIGASFTILPVLFSPVRTLTEIPSCRGPGAEPTIGLRCRDRRAACVASGRAAGCGGTRTS